MSADHETIAAPPTLREVILSSLRYWEARRILYNACLAAVVLFHFVQKWPVSRSFLESNHLLGLFLMAVLANVAYCAAYVVDVFVQLAGLHQQWARRRWIVLTIGIAFAAVITHFLSMGLFGD